MQPSVKNHNNYSKIPLIAGSFFWSLFFLLSLCNSITQLYAGCCTSKQKTLLSETTSNEESDSPDGHSLQTMWSLDKQTSSSSLTTADDLSRKMRESVVAYHLARKKSDSELSQTNRMARKVRFSEETFTEKHSDE